MLNTMRGVSFQKLDIASSAPLTRIFVSYFSSKERKIEFDSHSSPWTNLLARSRLMAPYPGKKALTILELVVREKELSGDPQSPISSPSLRLSAPSLRGLRVSGSRKVAHPVRVPTEGRVCRHTFSRGRARCQGPSPTVMKRGNFGLINGLVK